MPVYHCQARFEFTAWSARELGANQSGSQWLPPQCNVDSQYILITRHYWLITPPIGNTLKVCWSPQCAAGHLLYHTTWSQRRVQFVPWPRYCRLEAVKNHRRDHSHNSHFMAVCSCQSRDHVRQRPRIGHKKHRNSLGNEASIIFNVSNWFGEPVSSPG
jgi:hypothetical protein